jgi:hypothetical protein
MTAEFNTPMEKYETSTHDHLENIRCIVAHIEINTEVFNKLSHADKQVAITYEADRLKCAFIEYVNKELNL